MTRPEIASFFDTFGYLVVRKLFSASEMAMISQEIDAGLLEARNGHSFDGSGRQAVYAVVERRLLWMLEDDRMFGTVEALLGPNFTWIGSDSNLYVGDTSWHADNHRVDLPYETLKAAIYLDPVGPTTGCLRVVPGSHRSPLHENLQPLRGATAPFGVAPSDVPSVALSSEPGDVVFFNHRTYHASFGGQVGRRMFTMNFAAAPTTPEARDHLRSVYDFNISQQRKAVGSEEAHIYDDALLQSEHPRLKQLVQPLVEMGMT